MGFKREKGKGERDSKPSTRGVEERKRNQQKKGEGGERKGLSTNLFLLWGGGEIY